MKESLQYLIGVDKNNPYFTIYRNIEKGEIHIFYGAMLFRIIKDKKDSWDIKLMIAQLYIAKVNGKSLIKHFGYSYPTMKRWGDALKSGDEMRIYQAFSGQGAVKKLTPEIIGFIVHDFSHVYPRNKYSYSKEIRKDIEDIYGVRLSTETVRPVLRNLKDAYQKKGELTATEKKRLFKNFLSH